MSVYRVRTFIGPILLIGIGVVALLANLGVFDAEALIRLAQLWPVILILVGASLVINHFAGAVTATTLNLALAGLALVGAIAYAALGPVVPGFRVGGQHTESSAAIQGLQKAELDLGSGASTINVHGESLGDRLYLAKMDYPRGEQPSLELDRGSGTLSIGDRGHGHGFFFWPGRGGRRLDLALNSQVPWTVHVGGGANSDRIDLRNLQLTGLEVSGGATNAVVMLPPAKGKVELDVSGGANNVTLRVPTGSAVRVQASGGANSVSVLGHSVGSFSGDSSYQTDNYSGAPDAFDINLSGGASTVRVAAE